MQPITVLSERPVKQTWWNRNWKWVVPLGCLTPILVCGGGIALIGTFAFGVIKSSAVCQQAMQVARSDVDVLAALGSPIEYGFFVSGNINVSGGTGDADLSIPISGPKGSAVLYAVAQKYAGQWTFTTLQVVVKESGKQIDLLGGTEWRKQV